jgi:hypothetical protein
VTLLGATGYQECRLGLPLVEHPIPIPTSNLAKAGISRLSVATLRVSGAAHAETLKIGVGHSQNTSDTQELDSRRNQLERRTTNQEVPGKKLLVKEDLPGSKVTSGEAGAPSVGCALTGVFHWASERWIDE